jgi:alpha-ribazole phosphatase
LRLYLVRHGAASDAAGRCIGHCDIPLTSDGAAAVDRVGALLSRRPDRVVASDLARAAESARVLARRWNLPVAYDRRLREMHFGAWEGRPWSELERHDTVRLGAWMEDWVRVPAPDGESFEDVVARAREWLGESQEAWRDEAVVVVTHAGFIRAILCLWLATPLDWAFRFRVDPASVTFLSGVCVRTPGRL